jgi:hypothetical protein
VVEHYSVFGRVRQDLFGFADILGYKGEEILAVQTTSGANVAARIDKLLKMPVVEEWCKSWTRRLEVWGWRKVGKRGKRKKWECRVVAIEFTLEEGVIARGYAADD